ncbi:GCN5-related N-acetyltransferase [Catenulispora acidiphila DSM 44928]|uniref:GCN5-related N-acetyltransferase n=1 Tax=Catenulispora acidiphila (strain DSM 44928 / JCM 14897 / NBRC 102108 / NRRL B-24433 / ID139908) TaxID=479433 RepID=C7QAD8_CATAD|nr:GNAT family N-acetyltransferase [Catenulispora acidiphila]ACU72437.1 GCN5-related N-acetyltransferase [Catenulispora acidiphila DSM 44928]
MNFALFDPDAMTEADYEAITEMRARIFALDRPGTPPLSLAATIALMTEVDAAALAARIFWLARGDAGELVGFGQVSMPEQENTDTAIVFLEVDPDRRRQGIGTAFLRAVLPSIQAAGRTRVLAMNVTTDADGERFAEAMGAVCTIRGLVQTLDVAAADRTLWDIPAPQGYRVESWNGAVPEDSLVSYARARTAIADAPSQDHEWEPMAWTPERVRAEEALFAESGQEYRQAVAIHESSGDVAGITELVLRPADPTHAQQLDTAVHHPHRGHRLGRAMKAELLRSLVTERPAVQRVTTATASDNIHMIAVNHAIGYTDTRRQGFFETKVDDLAARLG